MMKFGHFIEYNEINISLQKSCKKSGGQTSLSLFLFFEKALYRVKASGPQLTFKTFR